MWSLFRSRSSWSSSKQAAPEPFGISLIPIVKKSKGDLKAVGKLVDNRAAANCVVGSPGSGKSSVLEALFGLDFFPHDPDMCMRRPLIIKLVHTLRRLDVPVDKEVWGEFSHFPKKRFYEFSDIRSEIQAQTDREAGRNNGVSDKPIVLNFFSPNVVSITLVDLPRITNAPVGHQPSNMEAIIRKMIKTYIKHETCIILVVSPANEDISNSDALQMARFADPNGSRTIGVITKI